MTIYLIDSGGYVSSMDDRYVTTLEDTKRLAVRHYWPEAPEGALTVTFDEEHMTVMVEDPVDEHFVIYKIEKIEQL